MAKKILIIEDSKNIAFVVGKCLKQNGFEVYKALDGVEAMVKIFEIMPDLILLDILVPKLNGYLICQALKSNDKVSNIPIVAMSAKTQETDVKKAFEAGALDYLTKPFTPEQLLEKVNRHI